MINVTTQNKANQIKALRVTKETHGKIKIAAAIAHKTIEQYLCDMVYNDGVSKIIQPESSLIATNQCEMIVPDVITQVTVSKTIDSIAIEYENIPKDKKEYYSKLGATKELAIILYRKSLNNWQGKLAEMSHL